MYNKLKVFVAVIFFCAFTAQLSPAQNCNDPGRDIAFHRLGVYRGKTSDGAEYQKTFFIPRYFTADWIRARSYCKAFNLESPSFETLNEARSFLAMAGNFSAIASLPTSQYIHIDGMTLTGGSTTDWYWTNSGRKISFTIPWMSGQPDFRYTTEYCFSIGKSGSSRVFAFNDIRCENSTQFFACQRTDFVIPVRVF